MGLMSDINIFIAVHIVLCLVFCFLTRHNNRIQRLSEFLIVLLVPIFGFVFMLVVKLRQIYVKYNGESPDVYYRKKNDNMLLSGKIQTEVNIIPLNDALFIEDMKEKRALLTNAIKQDILSNSNVLKKALKDSDREVSHYAVAMLTNNIEKIEADLFSIEQELNVGNENDKELLIRYTKRMKDYLTIDFLDKVSQRNYEEQYIKMLQKLLLAGEDNKEIYIEIIEYLINFGKYEQAENYCNEFRQIFPETEEQFISYMKLYWELKDYSKLDKKLTELKASPIRLTVKALEIIRFWDKGGRYV